MASSIDAELTHGVSFEKIALRPTCLQAVFVSPSADSLDTHAILSFSSFLFYSMRNSPITNVTILSMAFPFAGWALVLYLVSSPSSHRRHLITLIPPLGVSVSKKATGLCEAKATAPWKNSVLTRSNFPAISTARQCIDNITTGVWSSRFRYVENTQHLHALPIPYLPFEGLLCAHPPRRIPSWRSDADPNSPQIKLTISPELLGDSGDLAPRWLITIGSQTGR